MEDKLHRALEYVFDVAEKNGTVISWQVPECDEDGNTVLIQNQTNTGLIYHNCEIPKSATHFYLLEVELYNWAMLEGFSDADIFESEDFKVLEKVDLQRFCEILCAPKRGIKPV